MQNLQTMKQSVQKGFTLIELMIVVAIIGILAALAIPAYTDYTIKSRVSEGASLVGSAKTAVEVYWSENGTMISDTTGVIIVNADVDFTSQSAQYVSSVNISPDAAGTTPIIVVALRSGTAKLGGDADGTNTGGADAGCFEYVPSRSAGSNITWDIAIAECAAISGSAGGVAPKYLPKT
jgi:type IV pilus assembly protein PilA